MHTEFYKDRLKIFEEEIILLQISGKQSVLEKNRILDFFLYFYPFNIFQEFGTLLMGHLVYNYYLRLLLL